VTRWLGAALLVVLARSAASQGPLPPATGTEGTAGELRTVSGRVIRGGSQAPVAGQMVVLHRISADSSGAIDSVRSTSSGAYSMRYRFAGPRSMYIVSARYDGVAYFTPPLRSRNATGAEADVTVHDTTSVPFPLTVRARHFVIAPPDASGIRRVVDVFEVSNDSNRTLVASGSGATWRVRIPDGVREASAGGGDMPPDAIRFTSDHAELLVPFPPGSRQIVLTYSLPIGTAMTVPLNEAAGTLEVLLEGGAASVNGAGLAPGAPVSMEGRSFERYVAENVPAASSFTVDARGPLLGGRASRVALLVLALVAVALGIVIGRKGGRAPVVVPARSPADALAREVAALDRVYEAPERQSPDAQAHYHARRARLMTQLEAAMTVEDPGAST
jgi:hypothetical protein